MTLRRHIIYYYDSTLIRDISILLSLFLSLSVLPPPRRADERYIGAAASPSPSPLTVEVLERVTLSRRWGGGLGVSG